MVVFYTQELSDLETHGGGTSVIEEDFGGFVHFCYHLLGVHENTSVVYKIILGLKKITVGHDAL